MRRELHATDQRRGLGHIPLNGGTLSPSRQQLFELITRYEFSRIENVEILNSEPVIGCSLRILHEIKIGTDDARNQGSMGGDFPLQGAFVELFERIQGIGNGRIAVLEVRHHLPFRLVIERPLPGGAE